MRKIVDYIEGLNSRAAITFEVERKDVHVGHAILQASIENPHVVCQIDATSGKEEKFNTVLKHMIRLSRAYTQVGLKTGDVILLATPSHLQTGLILYVGLINGYPILPIDCNFGQKEFEFYIDLTRPKVIVCMASRAKILKNIILKLDFDISMIVLDDPEQDIEAFLCRCGSFDDNIKSFKPPMFDTNTPALLIATSGSTGLPKVAIVSHRKLIVSVPYNSYYYEDALDNTRINFLLSPPQWITAIIQYLATALLAYPRVQTTLPLTPKVFEEILQKYKPTDVLMSPQKLLELHYSGVCHMNSLKHLLIGGSTLNEKLEKDFKAQYPNISYIPIYGMTETMGIILNSLPNGPPTSLGKEFGDRFTYKIVEAATENEIKEPNVIGELWIKDFIPFDGYYNRPDETAKALSSEGYFKTGDLVYKDAEGNYFFSERLKMLLKYKSAHVYPTEIETVLGRHPAVAQVAVTGIMDVECGDLPTAVVVVKNGCKVTARELCHLVAAELADYKQLRGGVVFVNELPLLPTCKIDRNKLKEVAVKGKREF